MFCNQSNIVYVKKALNKGKKRTGLIQIISPHVFVNNGQQPNENSHGSFGEKIVRALFCFLFFSFWEHPLTGAIDTIVVLTPSE